MALLRLPGFAALLLGAAACMPVEPGESGVTAELNRLEGKNGFVVVDSSPARTVFAAKGRQVVIAPASGFCVAQDSLDVSGTAAFAILSDCTAREVETRAFPGILTVSVSGDPMIEPGSDANAAIEGLVAFLAADAGRGLLGRGEATQAVALEQMRRVGDGLYVLVRDGGDAPLPVLHPQFWRAFVELGGRMAMITVSGFRGAPVDQDQMLAFLVHQVVALKRANSGTPSAEELNLAAGLDQAYRVASTGSAQRVAVERAPDVAEGVEPTRAETPAIGQGVATLPAAPQQPTAMPEPAQPVGGAAPASPAIRVVPQISDPPYSGPNATPSGG